MHQDSK